MIKGVIKTVLISAAACSLLTGCGVSWTSGPDLGYVPGGVYLPNPPHPIYGPGPVISWSSPVRPYPGPNRPNHMAPVPPQRPNVNISGRPPVGNPQPGNNNRPGNSPQPSNPGNSGRPGGLMLGPGPVLSISGRPVNS